MMPAPNMILWILCIWPRCLKPSEIYEQVEKQKKSIPYMSNHITTAISTEYAPKQEISEWLGKED